MDVVFPFQKPGTTRTHIKMNVDPDDEIFYSDDDEYLDGDSFKVGLSLSLFTLTRAIIVVCSARIRLARQHHGLLSQVPTSGYNIYFAAMYFAVYMSLGGTQTHRR